MTISIHCWSYSSSPTPCLHIKQITIITRQKNTTWPSSNEINRAVISCPPMSYHELLELPMCRNSLFGSSWWFSIFYLFSSTTTQSVSSSHTPWVPHTSTTSAWLTWERTFAAFYSIEQFEVVNTRQKLKADLYYLRSAPECSSLACRHSTPQKPPALQPMLRREHTQRSFSPAMQCASAGAPKGRVWVVSQPLGEWGRPLL